MHLKFMRNKTQPSVLTAAALAGLSSLAAFNSSVVQAQSRPSLLEEITVKAQKREQSVNDVGVAISAFSGEQMEALNMLSAADVAAQSPGVEARRHFVGRGLLTNFYIRGIGSTDFNLASEASVAVFVDDFYLISPSTVDSGLFDLERSEIIKGPQSTLFGRNATGGAFQFFTNKPDDELSAYFELGAGTEGILQGETRINLPVTERLKLRFSALHDSHDTLTENTYPGGKDFHENDYNAFRGQALYDITDSWEILFKYETGKAEGNLPGDILNPMMRQADDIVLAETNIAGYSKDTDPNISGHNSTNYANNEADMYVMTNTWHTDNVTLTSITGYADQEYRLTEDCDASPASLCSFHPFMNSEHWSQEVRLNGAKDNFNWTAGVYYLNQSAKGGQRAFALVGLLDPNPLVGLGIHSDYELDLESYSVFGQLEYDLTDTVTLIGGLRFANDKKKFEQVNQQVASLVSGPDFMSIPDYFNAIPLAVVAENVFTKEVAGDLTELDDDSFSGTFQVNWLPDDNSLYYASFRRGIKSGGFNNGSMPIALPPEEIPYSEETLNAYEVGAKLGFYDGRIQFNSAIFYYDYEDFQASSFKDLGVFLTNADAKIQGVEAELIMNPIEGLDIILGGNYLDTQVRDITRGGGDPPVFDTADREMGEAPEFTFNALARYEWAIPTGYLAVQLDGNYVGSRHSDVLNQTAVELDSYSVWNTSLTYTSESDDFFVRAWIKNIDDERVATFSIEVVDLGNSGQGNWNTERTAGVTVGYHFR